MIAYRSNVALAAVYAPPLDDPDDISAVIVRLQPERVRDYILIEPETPPPNPFLQRFRLARAVAESVARDFDIRTADVIGASRRMIHVHARSVGRRLLADCGLGYAEIARRFCGTDHSTVIHGIKMFDTYAASSDIVADSYARHRVMLEAARQASAEVLP
jgi:hypothetical protein